jgi:ABC-type multidrug transport system fused ATPase/permease subunit
MLYLGVLLGTFVFEFAQTYLMQYTGQLAMFDLRKQLMAHLQRLDSLSTTATPWAGWSRASPPTSTC